MTKHLQGGPGSRRFVVTGGAGFIGSHVVRELLARGADVLVVDQQPPGMDVAHEILDVRDAASLARVLTERDTLIHLAACVGVDRCLDEPTLMHSVNTGGTEAVLGAARAAGVRRVLFSSSSEIYGDGYGFPFHEFLPPAPKSPYGHAKIAAEHLLSTAVGGQLSVRVVRLFNVYGPGQKEDFVVPRFVRQAVSGDPLTVYGDGTQLRCYTYIDDAVAGLLLAAADDGDGYDVFNIGNQQPCTVLELAEHVLTVTGSDSELTYAELGGSARRPAEIEIYHRVPDVRRARERLGFRAMVSLREGLSHMVAAPRADDRMALAQATAC